MPRWENFWVIIILYFYIEMMGHPSRRNLFFSLRNLKYSPLISSHYEWILIWWEQKVHLTISFWEKYVKDLGVAMIFFFFKKKKQKWLRMLNNEVKFHNSLINFWKGGWKCFIIDIIFLILSILEPMSHFPQPTKIRFQLNSVLGSSAKVLQ